MKDGLNYALFGTVVAVAAGLFGAYGLPDGSQTETSSFASAQLLGHVTYTVTDADGNVKAYRQLDNIIVDQGEDCAAKQLFANATTSDPAQIMGDTGTGTPSTCWFGSDPYVQIAIGNGSSVDGGAITPATDSDRALQQEHNQTGTGFVRISDSVPLFNAATGGTPASVVLSKDFTLDTSCTGGPECGQSGATQPADLIVNESGLFNSTTPSTETGFSTSGIGMFARQTFADVTVGDGESLTVEWTINIGGTGTITTGTEET